MEERTFQDIIKALMEDEEWEIPKEERAMYLDDIAWTINNL